MTLREHLTSKGYTPFYGSKGINLDWEYIANVDSLNRGYRGAIKKRSGSMYDLSITYVKSKGAYKINIESQKL